MSYWDWWQVEVTIPAWQLLGSVWLAFFLGRGSVKFGKET